MGFSNDLSSSQVTSQEVPDVIMTSHGDRVKIFLFRVCEAISTMTEYAELIQAKRENRLVAAPTVPGFCDGCGVRVSRSSDNDDNDGASTSAASGDGQNQDGTASTSTDDSQNQEATSSTSTGDGNNQEATTSAASGDGQNQEATTSTFTGDDNNQEATASTASGDGQNADAANANERDANANARDANANARDANANDDDENDDEGITSPLYKAIMTMKDVIWKLKRAPQDFDASWERFGNFISELIRLEVSRECQNSLRAMELDQ